MSGAARSAEIDLTDARGAAIALLGAGAVLSVLPGHAGVPCPLRTLTGVPCPLCGMTTSLESLFRGHLLAALQANPAGPLAVVVSIFLLSRRRRGSVHVPVTFVVSAVLFLWLFELHRYALL